MDVDQVKTWKYCINKRFSLKNRIASRWLKEFVCASLTRSLQNAVVKKYSKMDNSLRGGVMHLSVTLYETFQVSKEIKLAMICFVDFSRKWALLSIPGKHILVLLRYFSKFVNILMILMF
jgi:hypothetical protein